MSRFRIRRPSAALIVATTALFVAMAGTGYSAFSVPANSVGTSQLKNGAVTSPKLHDGAVTDETIATHSITGDRIKLSTLGTVPKANHANTATSAGSAQPSAFAHVTVSGGMTPTATLDTGNSKNVRSVTLNTGAVGLYCISGIPFTPKGGVASVDGNNGGGQDGAQVDLGTTSGCPSGTQAMVYTYSNFGATNDGFFAIFYG